MLGKWISRPSRPTQLLEPDGRLLSANLDLKNPNSAAALEHLAPEQLVEDILAKERRILEIMHEIKGELSDTREAAA